MLPNYQKILDATRDRLAFIRIDQLTIEGEYLPSMSRERRLEGYGS